MSYPTLRQPKKAVQGDCIQAAADTVKAVWGELNLVANSDEQGYGPSSLICCNLRLGLILNRCAIYSDILHPALSAAAAPIFSVTHMSCCVADVSRKSQPCATVSTDDAET